MADNPATDTGIANWLMWAIGLALTGLTGIIGHLHHRINRAEDAAKEADNIIWKSLTETEKTMRDEVKESEARIVSTINQRIDDLRDLIVSKPRRTTTRN